MYLHISVEVTQFLFLMIHFSPQQMLLYAEYQNRYHVFQCLILQINQSFFGVLLMMTTFTVSTALSSVIVIKDFIKPILHFLTFVLLILPSIIKMVHLFESIQYCSSMLIFLLCHLLYLIFYTDSLLSSHRLSISSVHYYQHCRSSLVRYYSHSSLP